jgi:AraC-like DNA-binding protein
MTASANALTDRVRTSPPLAATFAASDLQVFLSGLRQLGYDTDALLRAAHLTPQSFEHPDARIACEAYGAMFTCAQQTRFTPNLALELARVTPLGSWPLLDYLVLTTDTVGAGVHQLAKYLRLTGSPVVMAIHDTADSIRLETTMSVAPLAVEFFVALLHFDFRSETDGHFASLSIHFQHQVDDRADWERALGSPVLVNCTWSGVTIARAVWTLPLRRRDPVLRHVLEGHANAILERLPAGNSVVSEVQRALIPRVTGGDVRVQSVARELRTSARTLQRRLAEEGLTYQALVDGARKEAASRYLSNSNLAIGEVAYLVGFSEPAPFYRAFRRWFGVTPEHFRRGVRF